MYRLDIELLGLPKTINEWGGRSWHSKFREANKWHARLLGKMLITRQVAPPLPLKKAKVTLIRNSSREPDFDNLVQSFKPVVDALKKTLIIVDDSSKVIGHPKYEWQKADPKNGTIRIVVEEIVNINELKSLVLNIGGV